MIVAITPELKDVKEHLEKEGYKTVTFGKYDLPIDAIVYKMYSPELSFSSFRSYTNDGKLGVLMLNAQDKTLQEIKNILNTRLYSSLF